MHVTRPKFYGSTGCAARVSEKDVHIGGVGLHNHEHLGACERLKAVQVKCVRLQELYTCAAWRRGQLRGNGMQGVPAAIEPQYPVRNYPADKESASISSLFCISVLATGPRNHRNTGAYHILASRKVSFKLLLAMTTNSCEER